MAAYEYWRVQVQFTAGTWTEVTSDVDGSIRATNGATAETTGEPASLSLVLHNPGFKYTPGNTSSATALATGMPIRFFEVISDQYIYHFTGFVEFPEIDSVNLSMTQTQTISVNAIDQLSAWGRSATFVSTLGAHILGSAGTALKAYYPLNDVNGPALSAATVSQPALSVTPVDGFKTEVPDATLDFASSAGPAGEDVLFPTWTAHLNTSNSTDGALGLNAAFPYAQLINAVTLSGTDKLALVAWANLATSAAVNDQLVAFFQGTTPTLDIRRHNGVGGNWRMSMTFDLVNFLDLDHPAAVATNAWVQVAARLSLSPNLQEIYVNGVLASSAVGGVPPASVTYNALSIGVPWIGSLAHIQVYVLDSSVDFPAFLSAQRQVGLTGLERQTTGERIKTLGRWAGKTDGELVNVDTGCSLMQPARLAGLTIADAMYQARDTEQGDLFVDGTGALTFHDRRTILNI